jgi:hypothetical protein
MGLSSSRKSICLVSLSLLFTGCIQGLNVGGNSGTGGSGGSGGSGAAQGGSGGQAGSGAAQGGSGGQGGSGAQGGTGGQAGSGAAQGGSGGQAGSGGATGGSAGEGGSGGATGMGWSKHFGTDPSEVFPTASAVDANHNLYLAGELEGTVEFMSGIPLSGGLFVLKLDPMGNLVWARAYDAQGATATSMDLDAAGNIYLTGDTDKYVNFGGGAVGPSPAGNYDMYVAKLDPLGTQIWAKSYGDASDQGSMGYPLLAVDPQNNVFVTTAFSGTIDFGAGALVADSVDKAFPDTAVAKLDPNGNALFSRKFGIPNAMEFSGWVDPYRIGKDAAGNVVIGGHYQGTIDFGGPAPLVAKGQTAYFVMLGPDGKLVWQRSVGIDNAEFLSNYSLGVSAAGETWIAGLFGGTITFGGANLTGSWQKGSKCFAKLDAAGNHVLSVAYDIDSFDIGKMFDMGRNVAVQPDGSAAILTDFQGKIDLTAIGGPAFTPGSGLGTFVLRVDAAGQFVGAQPFATPYFPVLDLARPDGLGGLYVAGTYQGDLDLGFGVMPGGAQVDIVAARFVY